MLSYKPLTARMSTLSLSTKNTSRGNKIQALQARMSNARSEVDVLCEASPMIRSAKYSRNTAI